MADKKWYSIEDVELARSSLNDLPDLTNMRLTKSDVLEQLRDKIIELADNKGYSIEDIRGCLENAGIKTSVKSIREIMNARKKNISRTAISRKSSKNTTKKSHDNDVTLSQTG